MIEFVRVTAKTPGGDTQEYMWMGDISDENERGRLIQFMLHCCDDTSDRYPAPDEWNPYDWRDKTQAKYQVLGV